MSDENRGLVSMITELSTKLQIILDKQEELALNVIKIKDAIYDPDQGLYARLKDQDTRLANLEEWKSTHTKLVWTIIAATVSIFIKTFWESIF